MMLNIIIITYIDVGRYSMFYSVLRLIIIGILEKITDLNETNSIEEEINIEHQKYKHKQLKEKVNICLTYIIM